MATLNIGKDFSSDPLGRYYSDGPGSGEEFREEVLKRLISELNDKEKLIVILDDNVEGYGSSFLTEGFAGMVKYGYIKNDELLNKLELKYEDEDFEFYKNRILEYIKNSKYNSEKYISTKKE